MGAIVHNGEVIIPPNGDTIIYPKDRIIVFTLTSGLPALKKMIKPNKGGEYLVNYGTITKVLGNLLIVEAGLMVPSLLVALYYNQSDKRAFLISIVITSIVGFIMSKSFENKKRHKGKRRT